MLNHKKDVLCENGDSKDQLDFFYKKVIERIAESTKKHNSKNTFERGSRDHGIVIDLIK
jgi:hypothetical protein